MKYLLIIAAFGLALSAFANNAPVLLEDPIHMNACVGTAYSLDLNQFAEDPDGDVLSFEFVDAPAWLSTTSDGKVSGTPSETGMALFTVVVSDGEESAEGSGMVHANDCEN